MSSRRLGTRKAITLYYDKKRQPFYNLIRFWKSALNGNSMETLIIPTQGFF